MEKKYRNKSWVMMEPGIMESQARLDLSGYAAFLCLVRFHQKVYRKNLKSKRGGMKHLEMTNNGELIFTYGEAKELGIKSSRTFCRIIRELVEDKGFIDIAEQGNWYGKKSTKFAISNRWRDYGTARYKRVKIPRQLPKSKGFQKKTRCTGVKPVDCTGVKPKAQK